MNKYLLTLAGLLLVLGVNAQTVGTYRTVRDNFGNTVADSYQVTNYTNNYVLNAPNAYASATVPTSLTVVYFAASIREYS
ncbi:hypothetical protein EB077_12390 [bacterium]|nr:hypothetical protein [bacterium]